MKRRGKQNEAGKKRKRNVETLEVNHLQKEALPPKKLGMIFFVETSIFRVQQSHSCLI